MSSSLKNENTIIFFEEPCRVKGSGKSSGTKRKVAKKRKQTKKTFADFSFVVFHLEFIFSEECRR